MYITHRFSLDCQKIGSQKYIQGPVRGELNARRCVISLTQNGESISIPSDGSYVATVHITGQNDKPCTIENGNIVYAFQQSDFSTAGVKHFQLEILKSSSAGYQQVIYAPSFTVEIADSDAPSSSSSSQYTALQQALTQAQTYSNNTIEDITMDEDGTITIEFVDEHEITLDALTSYVSDVEDMKDTFEEWTDDVSVWTTAESGRVSAESSRASAESSRVSAESSRVSAENTREDNESDRDSAESSRVSAENSRVSAEASRVSAEASRVSAESSRQTTFNNEIQTLEAFQTEIAGLVPTEEDQTKWNTQTAKLVDTQKNWIDFLKDIDECEVVGNDISQKLEHLDGKAASNASNITSLGSRVTTLENNPVSIATTSTAGKVKPDGSTITVDADGTIHSVGGGGDASIDDTTTSTTSTWSSNKVTDYTQKANDIADALEDAGAVVQQSSANLLTIPDFDGVYAGVQIKIRNSIVHVTGTATDYINIKLTNGVDVGLGTSGGAKKSQWQQESMSNILEVGKSYSLTDFDTDLDVKIAIANVVTSARDNSYTNLMSRSKGLVTLARIPSYIQLYIRQTQTVDLKVGVVLMENTVPDSYIAPVSSDGYAYTTVSTLRNAGVIGDCISKFTLGTPTVVSGQNPYNIQGCCSDGDYIYYGAVSYDDMDNTRVGKIKISDMTLVTEVESYSLGHCNSMTYCNADGYIHCVALDNIGTVHRITTDLAYVDSYTISFSNFDASYTGIRGIAYSNDLRKFVYAIRATDKEGFAICSKERDLERMFWADRRQINALGGIECDKNFIYQVCYDKNVRTDEIYNSFEVFTWSGKRVAVLPVPITNETEEITNVKGTLYINENDSHTNAKFYKITPTATKVVGLV